MKVGVVGAGMTSGFVRRPLLKQRVAPRYGVGRSDPGWIRKAY